MKLSVAQWAWMAAVFAFMALGILDVAEVIAPPNWLWAFGPLLLVPIGWAVTPSMRQLRAAQRTQGRAR